MHDFELAAQPRGRHHDPYPHRKLLLGLALRARRRSCHNWSPFMICSERYMTGATLSRWRILDSIGGDGMDTTLTLIDLAGAVALLIWGVHMVQTGITRAFGPQLRRMLSYALGNRFKAFLAGLGVTSVLQSSTATGLMVTGFAAGGLVDLAPALAVMLGANIGTTLIV